MARKPLFSCDCHRGRSGPASRFSLAFGGGMFAYPYYCGVAAFVQREGLRDPDARLFGTSSGSMAAVLLATGVPAAEALVATLAASVAIPGLGVWLAYDGRAAALGWCLDGGLFANLADDPRRGWDTLRVAVWPQHSPVWPVPCRVDLSPSRPRGFRERFTLVSRQERRALFRLGERDAARHFASRRGRRYSWRMASTGSSREARQAG